MVREHVTTDMPADSEEPKEAWEWTVPTAAAAAAEQAAAAAAVRPTIVPGVAIATVPVGAAAAVGVSRSTIAACTPSKTATDSDSFRDGREGAAVRIDASASTGTLPGVIAAEPVSAAGGVN